MNLGYSALLLGDTLGEVLGLGDGDRLGDWLALILGLRDGDFDGDKLGLLDGLLLGDDDGDPLGLALALPSSSPTYSVLIT